jgi:hypothetical protein
MNLCARAAAKVMEHGLERARLNRTTLFPVMPALGAGIHVFCASSEDVDGRDKPGHDASLWLDVNAP